LDLFDSNTVPADLKVLLSRESIGQSPAVGEEKFVQGDRLRSYLNTFLSDHGYDPSEFTIRLPDRIVVVSESVQIHREKMRKFFANSFWLASPGMRAISSSTTSGVTTICQCLREKSLIE
jgi:hypothetical protein